MAIHKNSQRTVTCSKCGRRDFYWYHDDKAGTVECDGEYNDKCDKALLVADDATKTALARPTGGYLRHDSKCNDVDWMPIQATPTPTPTTTDDEVRAVTEAKTDAKQANDKANALADALSSLMTDALDEDKVRTIAQDVVSNANAGDDVRKLVEDAVLEAAMPTRVTIHDAATDTDRELPDVTHYQLPTVLELLDLGMNVWMTGMAGTGKSTIGRQCSEALGIAFDAVSCTPNMPLSQLTGYMNAAGVYIGTAFRDRFENGGVFLFDEIDNAHPSTLSVVNDALSNGAMNFPDGRVKKHKDFRCLAAANTFGTGPDRAYVGRLKIDAATLDRFWVVPVDVDEALEDTVAYAQGADKDDTRKLIKYVRHLRTKADEHRLPLVFSPRASIQGAKALNRMDLDKVVKLRIKKGISEADWAKVNEGWKK